MQDQNSAISPRRSQDFPEWYQQVVKAAEMAENSSVRGCMVIKPWGYGIWELMQQELDKRIKALGVENAYFPLFIPLSYLEKEAAHVDGFAKECAVVTHHRLKSVDGKLVPDGELEEPLIVRPTSETIIGESFANWIQSYRDLPLKINQWANVVRWEMRTRLFLRTAEFLWQEGHTAHASVADAFETVQGALKMYIEFAQDYMAMPVISGRKTEGERFPGAVETLCVEAMMQDRKAIQAGTSHYLGQNFAKASGIKFLNEKGELDFCHTTSWGVSTRLIGGLIMTHGDDNGMRVPPRLAPQQVVIIPINNSPETYPEVLRYAQEIKEQLLNCRYNDAPIRVTIDTRDIRGGDKNWSWIKRGAPIRLEVGPRDVASRKAVLYRRDREVKQKDFVEFANLGELIPNVLEQIQVGYYVSARSHLESNTVSDLKDFAEFKDFFTPKNLDKPEVHGGFVKAGWCGDASEEARLNDLKVTIRCLPFDQDDIPAKCIVTGRPATQIAIFAKAY
jgi:prolyl-tRNA synthetase